MEYTPVPADKQEDIKSPQRAAWFRALLDAGMLEMSARPTLSLSQQAVLGEQGQRFRTRTMDGKTFVWVEDIISEDLSEATGLTDDEVPA